MPGQVGEVQCSRLSALIADRLGLHFPPERWDDLQRGLAGAAREFGFDDPAACADSLLSVSPTKEQIQVLASHLTIGETYFFRERATLQALSESVLPELIRSRRGREQRLRLWSAACCSGEEPYSLAILLHQILPDLHDWRVTITATDINARFLQKAAAGVYGEWSFRNAPPGLKERYFTPVAKGRYAIAPEIRNLVTFAHLNLVEDVYPSLETDTNAMDVIFCRNVLMYFTGSQMQNVVRNLRRSLVEGGWLVVSPSEASKALFPRFVNVNFPGAIFFRKSDVPAPAEPLLPDLPAFFVPALAEPLEWPASASVGAAPVLEPELAETSASPLASAESLYQGGRYEECVLFLLESSDGSPSEPRAFSLLARALANQGKLDAALSWCERWIASDKMNPASHYLRAVVLVEQGQEQEARTSLQRAVYLDPDFVLAHFALGNLARNRGKNAPAGKHFANALHLLNRYRPEDPLPESEGLTAGRLAETITSITTSEM